MILFVLFPQEQDQSRVYCGKIRSFLRLCLRKSVKKVSLEKPPSHTTAAHGLFASPVIWWHRERPEGGPHHPFHCTAAHCRGTMLHQSCLHLAYSTMGADLAFLVAC